MSIGSSNGSQNSCNKTSYGNKSVFQTVTLRNNRSASETPILDKFEHSGLQMKQEVIDEKKELEMEERANTNKRIKERYQNKI